MAKSSFRDQPLVVKAAVFITFSKCAGLNRRGVVNAKVIR
jgi:hypothetical protein